MSDAMTRAQLTGNEWVTRTGAGVNELYQALVARAPREVQPYLPHPLVRWVRAGIPLKVLEGDFLLGLFDAARDFNCVGGMLFPVFCFGYWPLLSLIATICLVLPGQRVDNDELSLKQQGLG